MKKPVIVVKQGMYRSIAIVNTQFTLVQGFQTNNSGSFVAVRNDGQLPTDTQVVRIRVTSPDDIEYISGKPEVMAFASEPVAPVPVITETDDEAMARIATRFSILDRMAQACIAGDIRAMIVTGPPGVGKSHGIIEQMHKASLFDKIAGRPARFEVVKGAISGIGLFATLYKFSDPKNVLVFDDCDVWEDQDALNVLKGALDSGKTRRISWNKDSRLLRDEGVPNSFDFNGSIIFITNLSFDDRRSKKIQAHLDALQSRCHFLDLTIDTMRDKMLRIKQVHRDSAGGLFTDYDFDETISNEIIDFMEQNKARLREISLRMALKIADLVKVDANDWRVLTESTCMK